MIDGLLVNVNQRQLKRSLIATLSETYSGHFALAATKFSDPAKAFYVIEQARGRSLADTLYAGNRRAWPLEVKRAKTPSRKSTAFSWRFCTKRIGKAGRLCWTTCFVWSSSFRLRAEILRC
jgi:hypothetical protein